MNIQEYYGKKLDKLNNSDIRKEERISPPNNIQKVYIMGICGTAMGSIAGLLKQAGYKVSGWDSGVYPPMSTMLEDLNIEVQTEIKDINNFDVVVMGNAMNPTQEEVSIVRSSQKPIVSLSEILDLCIFKNRKRLVIAGTHGKTTTTGIVSAIFKEAKKDPGYLIGGVMQGEKTGFDFGSGDFFIIEGDEYDTAYFDKRPKFLTYNAHGGIVTSIELDHIDIYSDLTDYEQAFYFFKDTLSPEGNIFIANDDSVKRIMSNAKSNVYIYGLNDSCDVYIKDIEYEDGFQKGIFVFKGEELGQIKTPMSGKHNLMNIAAACGLAYSYGVEFEYIQEAVSKFKGMKRRQEVIAENKITLIDDFAHHPTAVSETIDGIKKLYEGRRVISIFEPRSNTSRRKEFERPYVESLAISDVVFIKQPASRHNDDKENYIDIPSMVRDINSLGKKAFTSEDLLDQVKNEIKEGDVILMMSNGSFDGLRESLKEYIESI